MVTILARSRWTSTAAKGRAVTWSRIRGIVCHYPAMGASVGVLTPAQETARLRGWRNYHVGSLGWADIGYNYCITQAGRVYSLRGDRVGAHAVGHNSTTLGVLFMVGDNEALTAKAQAAFRALRTTLRKRGAGSGLWGHTQMSGNSTRCPGPYIMADIRSGVLKSASAGATVGGGGTSAPKPAPKPSTSVPKATKAPAFPLPRTAPNDLFYYGPRDGGRTSVSGMGRNRWVGDDVYKDKNGRWHSKGLAKFQQRLIDRGWTELRKDGADGRFGKTTEKVVGQFQKAMGLPVDKKVGPATWKAAWEKQVK